MVLWFQMPGCPNWPMYLHTSVEVVGYRSNRVWEGQVHHISISTSLSVCLIQRRKQLKKQEKHHKFLNPSTTPNVVTYGEKRRNTLALQLSLVLNCNNSTCYLCSCKHDLKTGKTIFHQLPINMYMVTLVIMTVDGTLLWPEVDQGSSRYSTVEEASRTFRDSMALFRPSRVFLTSTWTSSMLHLFKRLTLSCSCW